MKAISGTTWCMSAPACALPFMTRDLNQLCYLQVTGASQRFWRRRLPHLHQRRADLGAGRQQHRHLAGQHHQPVGAAGAGNGATSTASCPMPASPFRPSGRASVLRGLCAGLAAPRTDNLYNGGNNGLCVTTGANPNARAASIPASPRSIRKPRPITTSAIAIPPTWCRARSRLQHPVQEPHRHQLRPGPGHQHRPQYRLGERGRRGRAKPMCARCRNCRSTRRRPTPTAGSAPAPWPSSWWAAGGAPINLAGKNWWKRPNGPSRSAIEYKSNGLTLGFGGKFTGRRFATDNNDYKVPSYFLADADITYDLAKIGWTDSYIKLNGFNLFNEKYLGSISSKPCFIPNLGLTSSCGSLAHLCGRLAADLPGHAAHGALTGLSGPAVGRPRLPCPKAFPWPAAAGAASGRSAWGWHRPSHIGELAVRNFPRQIPAFLRTGGGDPDRHAGAGAGHFPQCRPAA